MSRADELLADEQNRKLVDEAPQQANDEEQPTESKDAASAAAEHSVAEAAIPADSTRAVQTADEKVSASPARQRYAW